jgi:hypothetical protein
MLVSISYSLFANFVETTMFYWFLIIKKSLLICWEYLSLQYVATLRELLEQLAEEKTQEGLPR